MALSNSRLGQSGSTPYLDLPNSTDWGGQDTTLKPEIWSEVVKRDALEKNIFKDFMGNEGSNKPISVKRDISAGGAAKVTFTTTTPIRGQGVMGEDKLKGNEDNLRFGTFQVDVDLQRHAIAYTQVLQLLRFTGKTLDQLSAELMADWSARKQQDDCMLAFRNYALADQTIADYNAGKDTDNITNVAGKLTTNVIEDSKLKLIGQGAQPMAVDSDYSGIDVPQYLFFGPKGQLKYLKDDSAYYDAIYYAAQRSDSNDFYKGKLPMWDNNVIHAHDIVFDTAEGRHGSPFQPIAFLGTALASGAANSVAKIEGGGHYGNTKKLDYFANFLGAPVKFTRATSFGNTLNATADTRDYYATVYDTSSHEWTVFKYRSGGFNTELSEITVTGSAVACGANDAKAGAATVKAAAVGSIIYQSTADGTPISFAAHTGGNALYYATGAIENEPIYHYDDFATSGGRAHLTATGIQSIRGLGVYQDTLGRFPNYQLVQTWGSIAGVKRVSST